jgi:hypothetical protein
MTTTTKTEHQASASTSAAHPGSATVTAQPNENEHQAEATSAPASSTLADELGALDAKIKKAGGQGLADLLGLVANQFLGVPR